MYSMTAYASAEVQVDTLTVSVEIHSYNSKYLDIFLRLSHGYDPLEQKIKTTISEQVSRGRIDVRINLTDASEDAYAFEVNEPKAVAFIQAFEKLKTITKTNTDIPTELLATTHGIIKPVETEKDVESHWPVILDCLKKATGDLTRMRKKEGEFLFKDLQARLDYIEESISIIEENTSDLLSRYQERLKERIMALTQGITEIDPVRIAQEAAILADKSDISEEIVRAGSHVNQFRKIMTENTPVGKKLNFLLQEFNREFNTMASKSGNADISHRIVSVKSELEKLREQVQNVE